MFDQNYYSREIQTHTNTELICCDRAENIAFGVKLSVFNKFRK